MSITTTKKATGQEVADAYVLDLFYKRDPSMFAATPVDELGVVRPKKRHMLRFIASPAMLDLNDNTMPFIGYIAFLPDATIVDQMITVRGEWWGYITSEKPMLTSVICDNIFRALSFIPGRFFTDELPWTRQEIKRYEYTKLQHFKLIMRQRAVHSSSQ